MLQAEQPVLRFGDAFDNMLQPEIHPSKARLRGLIYGLRIT